MNGSGGGPYAPLMGIVVGGLVLIFRMRRLTQSRPLKLEWLWVTPALLLALTVVTIIPSPPVGLAWLWLAGALVVGGGLGWYRGKMMHITVDPQTHALSSKASAAALIFIVVLVVIRYGLRVVAQGEMHAWKLSAFLITDIFMAFAVGVFGVQRLEMWLRARRLLAEARGAKIVSGGAV